MTSGRSDESLRQVLTRSHDAGALGSVSVDDAIAHSRLYVAALAEVTGRVIDVGSGGGIPGLVIGWDRPDLELVLVDRRSKRTDVLRRACSSLEMADRVHVITGEAASVPGLADALTARLFGPVSSVVALASLLVAPGGTVVVSEPPDGHPWHETAARDWARSTVERPDVVGRLVRLQIPSSVEA